MLLGDFDPHLQTALYFNLTMSAGVGTGEHESMGPCTRFCECLFSEVTVQAVTAPYTAADHRYTPDPLQYRPLM
ncbi:hypothetical protein D9P95_19170 [Salmonella enterica subsp. enterica serovar Sandiego]|uniref:Uncharacterized protein n=1 Tax=Salmonella enterica TaxID=28901 RepID=A0A5U0Q6V3_SALER|nr:hypothetical protein [Salmonella enterica subsp. enterica serovar Montevideo]EAM4398684.1 hypothetical protein [Salmonella enterica]EBZ3098591.1 hypothetical protein [Salmonella enterica subsp. enterica serovar Sandiego]EDB5722425.1 hypothetical protein [Salmonella enterica subsp. enterica serovar Rubislaw]EDL3361700.1 hypothetical protein [Salmonella enterica subsp. enterica serovar Brandenburg]EDQ1913031.1 hypothetical protein [Salmonella enterica subsp. enterica]EDT7595541.1 hypothetica